MSSGSACDGVDRRCAARARWEIHWTSATTLRPDADSVNSGILPHEGSRMNSVTAVAVALIVGMAGFQQADPKDTSKTPGAIVGKWEIESSSGQKLSGIGQKGTIEFTRD